MRYLLCVFSVLFLWIFVYCLQAQSNVEFCGLGSDSLINANSSSAYYDCEPHLLAMEEKGPFHLRIYVHVIRRDNGSGGQSYSDVRESLSHLEIAFSEHNIFFQWDCNIDYIDETALYVNAYPSVSIFDNASYNPQPDGIDIYLFPDHPNPNAKGSGLAKGIGSSAFFVTGNYKNAPYSSLVRSHTLSHEMGHCLGLFHTSQKKDGNYTNPKELITRDDEFSNCDTAGDCLCDTPADPDIQFKVMHTTCEWIGDDEQDGVLYTPLTDNIMSLSHPDCYTSFTNGQGQRMRNVIVDLQLLQDCLIRETVSSNTT